MKLIKILLITLLFSTILQAEYLRTIRIGAFESENVTKEEMRKLEQFVQSKKNITDLQKVWDFEFQYKQSGGYYIVIAEPLRDREVLQEVIDTLRLAYPDAYPTRLKSAPPFKKKALPKKSVVIEEEKVIPQEIFETEVISQDVVSPKEETKVVVEEKNDTIIPTSVVEEEISPVVEKELAKTELIVEENEQKVATKEKEAEPIEYIFDVKEEKATPVEVTNDIYKILFYIALFLLFVVSLLLYKYKRKNVHCKDKEILTNQIFTKKDIEIRHKDSFLSHAKTSVADIHNFTNLLLEFNLTVVQKDYVQRIRSSSEHLLNTVNNTLDIIKLKNNTLSIENTQFDLNEMLKKVAKIISLEAKNNDTEFELKVEDDVPSFIYGDPTRIRQVLINLLGNSVKFTNNGKISLTIKTLYNYTNAITLGFIIKDTGKGMSSEQVEDILHSSVEIVEGGTVGLGLSVTKQLIELMHGEIKIYSTQDVGTTFTFTLKFAVRR